jgi:hypothetical protein
MAALISIQWVLFGTASPSAQAVHSPAASWLGLNGVGFTGNPTTPHNSASGVHGVSVDVRIITPALMTAHLPSE